MARFSGEKIIEHKIVSWFCLQLGQIFEKYPNIKFYRSPSSGSRIVPWRSDEQANRDRWLPPMLNWILPSSGLLHGVRWFETDVSGLPIGPIFNAQAVQDPWHFTALRLKMAPAGSPKTSVSNHLTPRNNPEYGRIQTWRSQKNAGQSVSWQILGGKDGRCVGMTTLPPSCADCLEILEPLSPGTPRASPGLYRETFTFTFLLL